MFGLVGKFFTKSTPPPFHDTEQSLRKQWNLSGDMTVQKLGNNNDIFLFNFRQENEKEKVVQKGPYNVNGVTIVIKNLNSLDMIDFTVATFTVDVFGLPSYFLNNHSLQNLGHLVGDYNPVLLSQTNRFISYRVDIDLKKPLRPGFYTQENQFVPFKYQNLGDFCYNCGMIDHVQSNCDLKFPKERFLYDKSITHVYGPWIRYSSSVDFRHQIVVTKSLEIQNCVRELEKTLSYAQFFIEIKFNNVFIRNNSHYKEITKTVFTHRFRFPCSYLDTETESTTTISSKAHEVLLREITANTPLGFDDCEHTWLNAPKGIGLTVEDIKNIRKYEFCCDDKWLPLKVQFNKQYMLTPVDFETIQAIGDDVHCEKLIKSKISDLIRKRVEGNENFLSISCWENQIREVISELGFTRYMHPSNVFRRAKQAMEKAIEMEISSSSCPKPADRSMVSRLKSFKVVGPDMDRLNPCQICFGEMFLGEEATIIPCSHVFHSSCIDKWFQVGHKCPLCGFILPSQN